MGRIANLRNYDALVDELVEMLKQFDKDDNAYNTDVYLYIDEDSNTGTLDTFVNVGGNSWLDDDHITIYTDKGRTESAMDYYFSTSDALANAVELSEDELIRRAADYFDMDEIDVEWYECMKFIEENEELFDKLLAEWDWAVDHEFEREYQEKANEIMDMADEDLMESLRRKRYMRMRRKNESYRGRKIRRRKIR